MHHSMIEVSRVGDERLFSCAEEECGRNVAFNPDQLTVTVLTPGDEAASHAGSTSPDVLTLSLHSR